MLGETSSELLKSIERSRRETNVKIKSLSRLLEALSTVEEVLSRAVGKFQGNGAHDSSPLTKDIVEPSSLGIHFTYFKDFPLTESSHLLRRMQTESEAELIALQKKQRRLEKVQDTILNGEDEVRKEQFALPKIEEGRLCTPKIRLGKVRRGENGLFKLTEEYTYMGEQEVENASNTLPTWNLKEKKDGRIKESKSKIEFNGTLNKLQNETSIERATAVMDSSNAKDNKDEDLWSDIIDINEMEKLDGMDPKTRGDYTAQFYKDLFQENDWLQSSKKKDTLLPSEKKNRCSEQSVTPSRETLRPRNKRRDVYKGSSTPLARLFSGKKDRSNTRRKRKVQTQKNVQRQEYSREQLKSKSSSKRVLQRKQRTQREPDILQEDNIFSTLTVKLLDSGKNKAVDAKNHFKEKFSDSCLRSVA